MSNNPARGRLPVVVIAPDSFKGTMDAASVTDALSDGVCAAGGIAVPRPLADGGEGTADALRNALQASVIKVPTVGPLGQSMDGSFLLSGDGTIAIVETATATGLHLCASNPANAVAASSYGTGLLLAAAAEAGAKKIWLGVGGSASTDGGIGAIEALNDHGGLHGAQLTVLCDVSTSYGDAARVFAPQKGADRETVAQLEERLHRLAKNFPRDPRDYARTGAAGGLSGALWASYDARLVSGIDYVLDVLDFDDLLDRADVVITGEGRLDGQTAHGKVVSGVARRALNHSVPVWAVVGQCVVDAEGLRALFINIVKEAGDPDALRMAAHDLTTAWIQQWRAPA